MFRAAKAAAAQVWLGVPVIPRQSTGTTESTLLRRAGIHAYGIDLFALTPVRLSATVCDDEQPLWP